MPFRDFVKRNFESRSMTPPSNMTQAQYVRGAGVTRVIHLERLDTEITRLPFVPEDHPPISHCRETNEKPQVPFEEYFSAEDEQLVWECFAEDFGEFGYERLRM
jgi:hypothetical protein